jgi:WS/DGAT/MGAT family acyltransferase
MEDDSSSMHIGSTVIFEGPAPTEAEFQAMVASKLPLVPRYRQKVRFVPLDLGRPLWEDDPHFNISYHVRHTALPAPGGQEQLRNLIGRVMSQMLDRTKPLWEMWVVEGLEDGHWALISKTHHAMVDGVSGTDLLAVMLDSAPDPERPVAPEWNPVAPVSNTRLLAETLGERVLSPYELVRGARRIVRAPRSFASEVAATAKGVTSMAGVAVPKAASSLNGAIGPHRRYSWARGRVSEVKTVRSALGGTLNDVVLAAISQGFRELLISRGESVEGRTVRSLVPVSVRRPGEKGSYNNRVSAMFAELPVGVEDPVERLRSVTAQLARLKDSKQAVAGDVLTGLTGFAPPMLLAVGMRVAFRAPQRNINTVTTNVPGPRIQLYGAGRRMLEAFPYVPLAGRVRIGIAIFSYLDTLNFGLTGDFDTTEDLDVLALGIEAGMADLVKASA